MNVNVTVTDPEIIAAMEEWEDGKIYNFTVTQDAPMKFTVTAAEEAPEVVEEEAEPEPDYAPSAAKKSPGIALLIAKEK